jgi:hypothetical protein
MRLGQMGATANLLAVLRKPRLATQTFCKSSRKLVATRYRLGRTAGQASSGTQTQLLENGRHRKMRKSHSIYEYTP